MKTVRLAVSAILIIVVVGGYAASQFFAIVGPQASADFEVKVNDPRVHLLMLVLLAAAIVLGFIPNREDRSQ